MEPKPRPPSLLADSLRAHALRFERPLAPQYPDSAGNRMLVAFFAVVIGMMFAQRWMAGNVGVEALPAARLVFVVTLLAAFFAAQQLVVGLPIAAVGLRRFSEWTRRERLYFFQVVPLAAAAFAVIFAPHLRSLAAQHGAAGFWLFSILTGLLWGMVQEFLYRGWLQTELARRWGAIAGLLAANLAFTFGPLHFNFLLGPSGLGWGRVAAVFGIGLFFGLIFRRSGNLWIPAVMHGLWPPNMS
jgi:membrane protease YdiL (CAAX protease family)